MASHVESSRLDFSSIGRRVAVRINTQSEQIIGSTMCLRRIVDWDRKARTITVMNCDDLAGTEATISEEFVFWWGQAVAREHRKRYGRSDQWVERLIEGIVDDALGMGDTQ